MAEEMVSEVARQHFDYDASTGSLRWRTKPRGRTKVGALVGAKRSDGYLGMKFKGRNYLVHRVIWLLIHGEWPTADVDHIDGNRSNNALANLRDVPRAMNSQNVRRARVNNLESGLLGATKRGRKWQASIGVDGMRKYLGVFETPQLAHQAYVNAKRALHPGNMI